MKPPTRSDEEYIRRIREETQKYTRELFDENTKLRTYLAMSRKDQAEREQQTALCEEQARRLRELEMRLAVLESEKRQTEKRLLEATEELDHYLRERDEFDHQLHQIEAEGRRYLEQYISVEQQNADLANLYVTSYRLHSALQRDEVIAGIQEIIINLVGSEELAIFEFDGARSHLHLIASVGVDQARYERIPAGRGIIGECIRTGEIFIAPQGIPAAVEEGLLTACIPLMVGTVPIGAIAIFRLLGQKSCLEEVDRQLFSLLATHAATALYASSLHARYGAAALGVV
jgi:hypothetical protein